MLGYDYGKEAANTWPVGNILGYLHHTIYKYVSNLKKAKPNKLKLELSNSIETHCIGYSLGSHVCSFFGKTMKHLGADYELTKIIGLDPAGPIFDYSYQWDRLALNKDDAGSVEIFHTNAEFLGYTNDLGDVDLYINGGYRQPWCPPNFGIPFLQKWINADCSHGYAHEMMLNLLEKDTPCVLENIQTLEVGNNLSFQAETFPSKPNLMCIGNKPGLYIGNLTQPSSDSVQLQGRYEITTDKKNTKCTIACKKEDHCLHKKGSKIMNEWITQCLKY